MKENTFFLKSNDFYFNLSLHGDYERQARLLKFAEKLFQEWIEIIKKQAELENLTKRIKAKQRSVRSDG